MFHFCTYMGIQCKCHRDSCNVSNETLEGVKLVDVAKIYFYLLQVPKQNVNAVMDFLM